MSKINSFNLLLILLLMVLSMVFQFFVKNYGEIGMWTSFSPLNVSALFKKIIIKIGIFLGLSYLI